MLVVTLLLRVTTSINLKEMKLIMIESVKEEKKEETQKMHIVYSIAGRALAICIALSHLYRTIILKEGLTDFWIFFMVYFSILITLMIKYKVSPFNKSQNKLNYSLFLIAMIVVIAIITFIIIVLAR